MLGNVSDPLGRKKKNLRTWGKRALLKKGKGVYGHGPQTAEEEFVFRGSALRIEIRWGERRRKELEMKRRGEA